MGNNLWSASTFAQQEEALQLLYVFARAGRVSHLLQGIYHKIPYRLHSLIQLFPPMLDYLKVRSDSCTKASRALWQLSCIFCSKSNARFQNQHVDDLQDKRQANLSRVTSWHFGKAELVIWYRPLLHQHIAVIYDVRGNHKSFLPLKRIHCCSSIVAMLCTSNLASFRRGVWSTLMHCPARLSELCMFLFMIAMAMTHDYDTCRMTARESGGP